MTYVCRLPSAGLLLLLRIQCFMVRECLKSALVYGTDLYSALWRGEPHSVDHDGNIDDSVLFTVIVLTRQALWRIVRQSFTERIPIEPGSVNKLLLVV